MQRKTTKIPPEIVRSVELINAREQQLNGTDDGKREAFTEAKALMLQAVLEVADSGEN